MIRTLLLLFGLVFLITQKVFLPIHTQTQFYILLAGVFLLGIPHGAADLLVATRNAAETKTTFSLTRFFIVYLGRLLLFAGILYLFPLLGNTLFILFAAYHFGETDLFKFGTNTPLGKLFVVSYGLLILSVILLPHFEEVKPILQLFKSGEENQFLINWIDTHRYNILSATGILFFSSTFLYFNYNIDSNVKDKGKFLVRLGVLLIILFNLPMLLSFTFYFVLWHSFLSLKNIVSYLRIKNTISIQSITKQIVYYSLLAMAGIAVFGLSGFMFINIISFASYIFLGLAVLTVPHMEIMYKMYEAIKQKPVDIVK